MSTPDVRQAMGRDDFERFHGSRKNKGLKKAAQRFERMPDGTYADDSVQRHWWTWQNSRAALAEQPASVLPKKPPPGLLMSMAIRYGG